jgi:hypothetical protein
MMTLLLQLVCLSTTIMSNAFVMQSSTTRTPEVSIVSSSLYANSHSVPPSIAFERFPAAAESSTVSIYSTTTRFQSHIQRWLQGQRRFIVNSNFHLVEPASAAETTGITTIDMAAASPPTKEEVALLREAFAAFYGTTDRDPIKALDLLTQVLDAWQNQPADERAGLYRVRGDCYMALGRPNDAITDYGIAIDLLQKPGMLDNADPVELPASL